MYKYLQKMLVPHTDNNHIIISVTITISS